MSNSLDTDQANILSDMGQSCLQKKQQKISSTIFGVVVDPVLPDILENFLYVLKKSNDRDTCVIIHQIIYAYPSC